MSELMHAITILAHVHGLCSLVYGCVNKTKEDQTQTECNHSSHTTNNHTNHQRDSTKSNGVLCDSIDNINESSSHSTSGSAGTIEQLLARMRELDDCSEEISPDEQLQRFRNLEFTNTESKCENRCIVLSLIF